MEGDGTFPINMSLLKPDEIFEMRTRNERIIADAAAETCNGPLHSDWCPAQENDYLSCIQVDAQKANEHNKKLDSLDQLKHWVQNPGSANEHGTLEGMALNTCIFQAE